MDVEGPLPDNPGAAMVAGDVRANENIALTATHTLFPREHNRIVGSLPSSLSEEEKFQIARRVVMPSNSTSHIRSSSRRWGLAPPYRGYDPNRNASLANEFAVVGYRAHSMIHGELESIGRSTVSKDFTDSPVGADDILGHGTGVAGVAAAVTDNSNGVAGVGYDASMLNGKVVHDDGDVTTSSLASGIRWAADSGADVINMSIRFDSDCDPNVFEDVFDYNAAEVRDAIDYAWSKHVVLVAAAATTARIQPPIQLRAPRTRGCQHQGGRLQVRDVELRDVGRRRRTGHQHLVYRRQRRREVPEKSHGRRHERLVRQVHRHLIREPARHGLAALVSASCFYDTNPQAVVDRITSTAVDVVGTGTAYKHGGVDAARAVCFPRPGNVKTSR